MRLRAVWMVAGFVLSLPAPASSQPVRPRLLVRVYNGSGVSRARLGEAELGVRTVLTAAGVDTEWRGCAPRADGEPAAMSCDDAIQPDEIVVRLLDAAGASVIVPTSLGFSYVDRDTRRGWLATAFADRVDQLAGRLHISAGRLLGRTIVHEIGHLVLGTVEHAASGVMQKQLSDLTILTGGRDRFRPDEASGLRDGVLARTRQPLPAGALARLATVLVP